jgi:hypothetical protein
MHDDGGDDDLEAAFDEVDRFFKARDVGTPTAIEASIAGIAREANAFWGGSPPARTTRPRPVKRPVTRPLHERLGSPRRPAPVAVQVPARAPWERKGKGMACKNGHFMMAGHKFCGECGSPAGEPEKKTKRCVECGQPLPADRGAADESFQKAHAADPTDWDAPVAPGDEALEWDDTRSVAALLPGVADISADRLLFKASHAGLDKPPLSTHDIAKLEIYAGNGMSLHKVAAIDRDLALRVHRALGGASA